VTERVLLVAFQVAALAAIGYWIFARPSRRYSSGAVATLALAGVGAFALIDGFSLAVVEESRARYGQVVTGVVEERLSTTGELGTRTIGGRRQYGRGPTVRTTGFDVYQTMTRAVVTGSFDAWVIDYRYPCSVPGGMCRERDFVPHDLVTISSRCARIEFRTIDAGDIEVRLREEGVDAGAAHEAAVAAGGSMQRARVLATDPDLADRRRAFADVPRQIDGTGATVVRIVDDLLARIEAAAEPLAERQAAEVAELDERIARYGERGSGKKTLEDRHKRELRRHRTDELLAGLTVIAGTYRDAMVAGAVAHPNEVADAVTAIQKSMEAFERNPNESLLLQQLLWLLPVLSGASPG